jgi:histidinol-phosphatase (PHP family)
MIDLHLHTPLCRHATGTVSDYVAAARSRGVTTVCFTDHLPLPASYPDGYAMRPGELPGYVSEVRAAASASATAGGPEVLCGIEADWIPEAPVLVADAVCAHAFDVVLGSVHFVDGWAFDDPDLVEGYETRDIGELWEGYFAQVQQAARSGLFDVMAHLDLVKKFGFFPERDPRALYQAVAETLATCGLAVEVNTAGLRKPVREIYPSLELLKACRRHGVLATTGSDAHTPSEVGSGLDEAARHLRAAGYDSVVVFRRRVPEEVPLWG